MSLFGWQMNTVSPSLAWKRLMAQSQHVTVEKPVLSAGSLIYSVSPFGLIQVSFYEFSIISSVTTSYSLLVLYHSNSPKKKICGKSAVLSLYFLWFSLCQCHCEVLEGYSWLVAELQSDMQFFGGLVSEWEGGCSAAYSTSYHMGRLQSRKERWQTAILSLHQDFIADGMLRILI